MPFLSCKLPNQENDYTTGTFNNSSSSYAQAINQRQSKTQLDHPGGENENQVRFINHKYANHAYFELAFTNSRIG
jgi:hypothetical protein